jgi:hypothetical protein
MKQKLAKATALAVLDLHIPTDPETVSKRLLHIAWDEFACCCACVVSVALSKLLLLLPALVLHAEAERDRMSR